MVVIVYIYVQKTIQTTDHVANNITTLPFRLINPMTRMVPNMVSRGCFINKDVNIQYI